MGTVVTIPEAALDYALYGDNTHVISNYLMQQMQAMPQALNNFASKVYNAMLTSYNYVTDAMTKHRLIGTLQHSGIAVIDNYIHAINDVEGLQNANPTMQRWIMCHPEVRKLYLDQNIDGYSDTYRNVFGKGIGEDDYNYRRVYNGVLRDDGHHMYIRHYHEELLPGDRELDHHEKVSILSTHSLMDLVLKESDIDFTCKSTEPVKINRE